MTNEMRNSWPLPEMPDEAAPPTQPIHTAGEAGVVGALPHPAVIMSGSWSWPPLDQLGATAPVNSIQAAAIKQFEYELSRRAHTEAIGRPYPDERHAVWPR